MAPPATATASAPGPGAEATRRLLVDAAERLFAERGVDGVSLREIGRAASQANTNAAQYHFGSRSALVGAVLARHRPAIEARRHALLDSYEVDGRHELRALAAAFVLPLASELADPSGRAYLQIMSELINRPDPVLDPEQSTNPTDSVHRWRTLVEPFLAPDAASVFHARFAAMRFAHQEFGRRAAARHRRDDRLFASRVTDLVAAILGAPVSLPTQRLLDERARS